MADDDDRKEQLPAAHKAAEIEAFLRQVKAMPAVRPASSRGRLIFALDTTATPAPTWDRAAKLQGEMFAAAAAPGGLEGQLVFYRGLDECQSSPWLRAAPALH